MESKSDTSKTDLSPAYQAYIGLASDPSGEQDLTQNFREHLKNQMQKTIERNPDCHPEELITRLYDECIIPTTQEMIEAMSFSALEQCKPEDAPDVDALIASTRMPYLSLYSALKTEFVKTLQNSDAMKREPENTKDKFSGINLKTRLDKEVSHKFTNGKPYELIRHAIEATTKSMSDNPSDTKGLATQKTFLLEQIKNELIQCGESIRETQEANLAKEVVAREKAAQEKAAQGILDNENPEPYLKYGSKIVQLLEQEESVSPQLQQSIESQQKQELDALIKQTCLTLKERTNNAQTPKDISAAITKLTKAEFDEIEQSQAQHGKDHKLFNQAKQHLYKNVLELTALALKEFSSMPRSSDDKAEDVSTQRKQISNKEIKQANQSFQKEMKTMFSKTAQGKSAQKSSQEIDDKSLEKDDTQKSIEPSWLRRQIDKMTNLLDKLTEAIAARIKKTTNPSEQSLEENPNALEEQEHNLAEQVQVEQKAPEIPKSKEKSASRRKSVSDIEQLKDQTNIPDVRRNSTNTIKRQQSETVTTLDKETKQEMTKSETSKQSENKGGNDTKVLKYKPASKLSNRATKKLQTKLKQAEQENIQKITDQTKLDAIHEINQIAAQIEDKSADLYDFKNALNKHSAKLQLLRKDLELSNKPEGAEICRQCGIELHHRAQALLWNMKNTRVIDARSPAMNTVNACMENLLEDNTKTNPKDKPLDFAAGLTDAAHKEAKSLHTKVADGQHTSNPQKELSQISALKRNLQELEKLLEFSKMKSQEKQEVLKLMNTPKQFSKEEQLRLSSLQNKLEHTTKLVHDAEKKLRSHMQQDTSKQHTEDAKATTLKSESSSLPLTEDRTKQPHNNPSKDGSSKSSSKDESDLSYKKTSSVKKVISEFEKLGSLPYNFSPLPTTHTKDTTKQQHSPESASNPEQHDTRQTIHRNATYQPVVKELQQLQQRPNTKGSFKGVKIEDIMPQNMDTSSAVGLWGQSETSQMHESHSDHTKKKTSWAEEEIINKSNQNKKDIGIGGV